MPIFKSVKVPTGLVADFHTVTRYDFMSGTNLVRVTIASYLSQADFGNQAHPVWVWEVDTSSNMPPGKDVTWVLEDRFVHMPDSIFYKGTMLEEPTAIAAARAESWTRIKYLRNNREHGGFDWRTYRVDSDPESQRRIQYAAQVAESSIRTGTDFQVEWTMADNRVAKLDAQAMLDLSAALWEHVRRQHFNAFEARKLISSSVAPQEALDVVWTDYFAPGMPAN